MGWTYTQRPKGLTSARYFQDELLGEDQEILDSAVVGTTFYAAVRDRATAKVFGLVVLFRWTSGYWNFGYKPMTEDMGPFESQCPDRILDLLTPTDDDSYALAWRQRCRDYNAKRRAKPKVKPGDVVRVATPVEFTNGTSLDTFAFERRNDFRSPGGGRYRITGWQDMDYTVLTTN